MNQRQHNSVGRVGTLACLGLTAVLFLLIGCGRKEAEPSAKGYYEGPTVGKGANGVKTGGSGGTSDTTR